MCLSAFLKVLSAFTRFLSQSALHAESLESRNISFSRLRNLLWLVPILLPPQQSERDHLPGVTMRDRNRTAAVCCILIAFAIDFLAISWSGVGSLAANCTSASVRNAMESGHASLDSVAVATATSLVCKSCVDIALCQHRLSQKMLQMRRDERTYPKCLTKCEAFFQAAACG